MKIVLFSTDNELWGFGVRSLAAVLRRSGHPVRLILLPSEAQSLSARVLDQARELAAGTGLIGVSCHSRGAGRARQLITHLRALRTPVVWGGLHATLNPRECAQTADMVCRGEGEGLIVELAGAIAEGKDWSPLENLAFLCQDRLVLNRVRPPVPDLDVLPTFDFQREDEHHLVGEQIAAVSPRPEDSPGGQALFVGSRGCAYRCTYCSNRKLRELYAGSGRYLRRMTVARYVEHLELLSKTRLPNVRDWFFMDEDFFLRTAAELREFAALYRRRVGLPFECMASPTSVTVEKLEPLVEAGLWRLRLGIESGSERTKRAVYDRPISNPAVLRAAQVIGQFPQVTPNYFFIIGNPYEEQEDLLDTLRLLTRLPRSGYAQMFNLVLFPGSALYDRALADGVIRGPEDGGHELDFFAGLDFRGHPWKRKNLYLNALLFLAEGKSTRFRLGLLPRCLLPLLAHPRVVRQLEPRTAVSRALIAVKRLARDLRARAGRVGRRLIGNPAELYSLRLYLKNTLRRAAGQE